MLNVMEGSRSILVEFHSEGHSEHHPPNRRLYCSKNTTEGISSRYLTRTNYKPGTPSANHGSQTSGKLAAWDWKPSLMSKPAMWAKGRVLGIIFDIFLWFWKWSQTLVLKSFVWFPMRSDWKSTKYWVFLLGYCKFH